MISTVLFTKEENYPEIIPSNNDEEYTDHPIVEGSHQEIILEQTKYDDSETYEPVSPTATIHSQLNKITTNSPQDHESSNKTIPQHVICPTFQMILIITYNLYWVI